MKFSYKLMSKLRKQTGKSPEAVTQDLSDDKYRISRNTLVNWEKGKTRPSVTDLERLAKVYNCEIWSFFAHDSNQTTKV